MVQKNNKNEVKDIRESMKSVLNWKLRLLEEKSLTTKLDKVTLKTTGIANNKIRFYKLLDLQI